MPRLRTSILTRLSAVSELFSDLLRLANAAVRSQGSLVAENLFLRKQLAFYQEREVGPRRLTDAGRLTLVFWSRWFNWKDALIIVKPETLIGWHRKGFRLFWRWKSKPGRPRLPKNIRELIVRMARENPSWGYTRIQGALGNLSHKVGRGTIANVLKRNGIEPSPERGRRTKWSTFLKAHWKVLAASDFLTVEVRTSRGLVTHYLLLVISLSDRVVNIAGITTRPDESWMLQIGRNEIDSAGGSLHSKRYRIIDRDTKYSGEFRRLIRDNGTKVIRLPPRSPNLNAYAERFVRSIKDECLDRIIFVGQASLRRAVSDYMHHYHTERNHQGLDNRLIVPTITQAADGAVNRRARLGGTLNFYYRNAA